MKLLKKVLLSNKGLQETFLYKLLKQQLLCLLPGEKEELASGMYSLCKTLTVLLGRKKWDPAIIHWCLTLQYHGGQRTIDTLRGKGFQDQGKHGHLWIKPDLWGLILPANSTLRNYVPSIEPYKGIMPERCQLLAKAIKNDCKVMEVITTKQLIDLRAM